MAFQPQPEPQPTPPVAGLLESMGLTSDDLRHAVLAGNDEASGCTGNDVISRAGFLRWSTPLRFLGDVYVSQGFTRERPKNFEVLVSPNRTFAISVAPGDYATGTERMPSTRIDRGPLTGQAVGMNRGQLGFDPSVHPQFAAAPLPDMQTWLLLQYLDEAREEIRVELSVPVEFTPAPKSARGFVTRFDPRLVLPPIPLTPDGLDHRDGDDGEEIEIPINRR